LDGFFLIEDWNAMLIGFAIIVGFVALTGLLLGVEAFFRRNTKEFPQAKFTETKRKHIVRGIWSFSVSSACLLLLVTGYASPILVIITLSMLLSLGYALSLVNLHDLLDGRGK
jgi:hypothetical protein